MGEKTPHPSTLLFSLSVQVSCLALDATLCYGHLKRDTLAVVASTGCLWSSTYPRALTELCLSCASMKGGSSEKCPFFCHSVSCIICLLLTSMFSQNFCLWSNPCPGIAGGICCMDCSASQWRMPVGSLLCVSRDCEDLWLSWPQPTTQPGLWKSLSPPLVISAFVFVPSIMAAAVTKTWKHSWNQFLRF